MSTRWIVLVFLVAYGLNTFASIGNFNEIIGTSEQTQHQLASELQTQLGIKIEKNPEQATEGKSISAKGFSLRVFDRSSL